MTDKPQFIRLLGDERRVADTLEGVSKHWQGNKECFLFISPHDDDVVLGGGLLMQLAQLENVPVYIMIVTDGAMGYCSSEEKDSISRIREKETFKCYQSLGIPKENIFWLGFPDSQVHSYRGRRAAGKNEKAVYKGFTGLQNAFTYFLRKTGPTQCFLPTLTDLHPDHKIVYEEFLISVFHASGNIWPELGKPLEKTPYFNEMAVYCDFPTPPQLQMKTPLSFLEKKLEAISSFRSQKQIESLIEIVRNAGPYEYIRSVDYNFYNPNNYKARFKEDNSIGYMHR